MKKGTNYFTTNSNTIPRSSNFELLRIVCMIMIITHHYSLYGHFNFSNDNYVTRIIIEILTMGGKLGVNCFVMITGYFSTHITSFRWKSIFRIVFQVTFFSVVLNSISFIINPASFGITSFIKMLLPINSGEWWFATTYVLLLLFVPFLNIIINSVSRKTYVNLLAIMFVIWSVMPTLGMGLLGFNEFTWFVFLYFTSAYIKKYPINCLNNKKSTVALFVLNTVVVILPIVLFNSTNIGQYGFITNPRYFGDMNRVPLFLQSLFLFGIVRSLKMRVNKFINGIASCMFGVYLIHDSNFMRVSMWEFLFKNIQFKHPIELLVHAFITILFVFVTCTLFSFLYNITISKIERLFVKKIICFTDNISNKLRMKMEDY